MTRRSDPTFDPIADWHRRNRRPTLLEELWGLTRIGLFLAGIGLLAITVVLIAHLVHVDASARDFLVPLVLVPIVPALLWLSWRRTIEARHADRISRALMVLAPVCALYDVGPLTPVTGWYVPGFTIADPMGSGSFFVGTDSCLMNDWVVVSYRWPRTFGISRELAVISSGHDLFARHVSLRPTPDALTISVADEPPYELTIPRSDLLELLMLGPRRWHRGEESSRCSWTPFELIDSLLMLAVAAILRRGARTSGSST